MTRQSSASDQHIWKQFQHKFGFILILMCIWNVRLSNEHDMYKCPTAMAWLLFCDEPWCSMVSNRFVCICTKRACLLSTSGTLKSSRTLKWQNVRYITSTDSSGGMYANSPSDDVMTPYVGMINVAYPHSTITTSSPVKIRGMFLFAYFMHSKKTETVSNL